MYIKKGEGKSLMAELIEVLELGNELVVSDEVAKGDGEEYLCNLQLESEKGVVKFHTARTFKYGGIEVRQYNVIKDIDHIGLLQEVRVNGEVDGYEWIKGAEWVQEE